MRQKFPGGKGFRAATELSFGRTGKHDLNRVSPWSVGSLVKSYLFRNFPPSCMVKELIAKFHEVGMVVDLYRLKKRDVQGKNFGFVRLKLENEAEGEAMLGKLNSLWMRTYKLQVYNPRFDRVATREVIQKKVVTTISKPAVERFAVGDRSFASIVKGNATTHKNFCNNNHRVTFIPTAEDKEWLENAKVGLLKKEFPWEDFGDDIQKEVQGKVVVKGLGEDLILIQDHGDDEEDK